MVSHLVYVFVVGWAVGLACGFGWGRRNGNRALDRVYDEGFVAGRNDGEVMPDEPDPVLQRGSRSGALVTPGGGLPSLAGGPPPVDWRERTAAELAPEVLAQDVPEPGHAAQGDPASGPGNEPHETTGLGHPSPYGPSPTPAQRRRDKHKQRGEYAPGDMPDPPSDVSAWWQAELEDLLRDGQSDWLTRQLAEAAA